MEDNFSKALKFILLALDNLSSGVLSMVESFEARVTKLENKMAIFDELTTAISAQTTAITALEAAVSALPAPIDHAPLAEAITALQANTKVLEAMVGVLPHHG